jgi:chemotaxis protein MotB
MARRRSGGGGGGAPEWLVTFADLMSLLCCFFVLIISFSAPDDKKVQVVSGSMREAFGVQPVERRAGMIEIDGVPVKRHLKDIGAAARPEDAAQHAERHDSERLQGPEANTHDIEKAEEEKPRQFATAAASIRQAWRDLPDIAELSRNLHIQETAEGLDISIVDQEGRSMFPEGARHPYDYTRRLIEALGPVLARMPHRVRVTGHTSAGTGNARPADSAWELSAGRALSTRRILGEAGVPGDRFESVVGRADTDPLFPNDPFLAANRRISILVVNEKPPLPTGHRL